MAEPGLSELITTTGRLRSMKLKDNVSDSHPVLVAMEKYDGMVSADGGRTIIEEMAYAQNGSVGWYVGNEEFDSSTNPTMTSAEYQWKQLGGSVFITGLEKRQNNGKEQYINLVTSRMQLLEDTMMNQLHAGLVSDGTGSSGKQLAGLKLLIAKTPTSGTVGGINRASSDAVFFRNYKFNTASDWSNGSISVTNVKQAYDKVIDNTTRLNDKPKIATAGTTHWEALMGAMQAIQRVEDPDLVKAGFENIVYRGVPVVFAGGISFSGETIQQADLTYFINTKYLKLVYHKDANFDFLEEVQSINQDMIARLMVWMGACTLSNAKAQGVLYDT